MSAAKRWIESVYSWIQRLLKAVLLPILALSVTWGLWIQATAGQGPQPWQQPIFHHASIIASQPTATSELRRWAVYKIQKFFSQNIFCKITGVAAIALPMVLVFGYAYRRTSGKSMGESMFQVYSVLQDTPGATACDEPDAKNSLILNLVWIVGIFSYALVLGIVSDDVAQNAEAFKAGNTSIVERGHTVVLNINNSTESMLRQWAKAQMERGHKAPIVLLADKPKDELNSLVNSIRADTGLDVMGREGLPYNVDDLRFVSADKAKTVIVMDPQLGQHIKDNPEKVQPFSATLVSLAALGKSDAQIVLQLPHEECMAKQHKRDMLQSAMNLHVVEQGLHKVVQIDAMQSLRDAKTQCAVSPGVAGFYEDIFSQSTDSVEVYCKQFSEIDGMTFKEARYHFKSATLLGYCRDGNVRANPPDAAILRKGDWLFGLADNGRCFIMSRPIVPDSEPWVVPKHAPEARAHSVIVAAFEPPSADTIRCLHDSMPDGGCITIICEEHVGMPDGKYKRRMIKGHPANANLLQKAGIETADSLLLSGMHEWEDTEADIQVLCSVAQLSDVVAASQRRRPLHVVAEARGPLLGDFTDRLRALQARRSASSQLLTTDILPTEQLLAGVVAQCGMQPELANVLKELFDVQDAAVMVRHPLKYMKYGETVPFWELQERARQHGEIIVGVVDTDTKGSVVRDKMCAIRHSDIQSFIVLTG